MKEKISLSEKATIIFIGHSKNYFRRAIVPCDYIWSHRKIRISCSGKSKVQNFKIYDTLRQGVSTNPVNDSCCMQMLYST
ncbi:hypothetical protein BpHYR1_027004 [Brachionus plicatilis]|uniref:Uncharacterized protein n=1 Tax=Brachionus plicatilis TaxID=10195 RepID=A0A3M7SPW8_BRAPC|nr:hypothetical protein BpHYR1_027004 [Brachionus plicatilis]